MNHVATTSRLDPRHAPFSGREAPPTFDPADGLVAARALRRGPGSPMNTAAYLLFAYGCGLLGMILLIWACTDEKVTELFAVALPLELVAGVATAVLWHRAWAAIQDGRTRTPGFAAASLLWIPFYNFIWLRRIIPAFAEDHNAMLERHGLNLPRLDQPLFQLCGLSLVIPGFNLIGLAVILPIVISRTCDAVNRINGPLASALRVRGEERLGQADEPYARNHTVQIAETVQALADR